MLETIEGAICTPAEYDENLKVDFSSVIKKKGSIDYVPWGEIVRTLHKAVPGCTYGFKSAPDGSLIHYTPTRNAYLRPYLTRRFIDPAKPGESLIVESPAGFFPISNMASRHKAIEDPDIRSIDNCLRRAVAKEIGIHTGLGLALWADSDPYDLVEEEDPSKLTRLTVTGSIAGSSGTKTTEAPAASRGVSSQKRADQPSIRDRMEQAAENGGLNSHGKQTVAIAVKADSWDAIPDDKIPRIMSLLGSNDHVKLFNAGRNSSGKEINPKDPQAETREIVEAFKKASEAAEPKA